MNLHHPYSLPMVCIQMGYKYLIVIMGKKQSKKDGEYRVRDMLDFK
jgi:hypothetical protein